jgi:AAA15 family ATPase/GTPase
MEKRIVDNIVIKNFKSLHDVKLENCRTYNILLGCPNAGKSNILEALSVFSLPDIVMEKRKMNDVLRFSGNMNELFFNCVTSEPISIIAGLYKVIIRNIDGIKYKGEIHYNKDEIEEFEIENNKIKTRIFDRHSVFKKYIYSHFGRFEQLNIPFCSPIRGEKLMQEIQINKNFSHELADMIAIYGFQVMFDFSTQEIKLAQKIDENCIFTIPFHSISDTLQRLIFYKAIISSNHDTVLMLEEIEAHSYPPYISKVTHSILDDTRNQYFITTHSPYVINDFLEEKNADVAIFIIDYKDGETIIRRLTDKEVQKVYDSGIDLFFNQDIFFNKHYHV